MKITQKLVDWLDKNAKLPDMSDDPETRRCVYGQKAARALLDGSLTTEKHAALTDGQPGLFGSDNDNNEKGHKMPSKDDVYGKSADVRVKKASEMYSDKQWTGRHKSGQPVFDQSGCEAAYPSQREYAYTGSLLKHLLWKGGLAAARPTEHEAELLAELATDKEWAGDMDGDYYRSIKPAGSDGLKALLDDSTSGGTEVTPVYFDDSVISTPLLSGELFPFVDKRDVPRGRRVEGASIGSVNVTSGEGADNSEMSLFDTSNLISAIDTTIFNVGCAVELGLDSLSDAAVSLGQLVTTEIGKSLQAWLDEQIAIGDGTNEPEGVMNCSGTTSVSWGVATSIGNYESLCFSVPKAQRPKNNQSVRFIGTETSYQRARGIPVGTSDARRVFGMDHESFMLLNRPYAISTALSNNQVIFGDLSKFRMYLRKGFEISTHTAGNFLARRNLALVVAKARFGGRVMLPSSFGVVTDAPA